MSTGALKSASVTSGTVGWPSTTGQVSSVPSATSHSPILAGSSRQDSSDRATPYQGLTPYVPPLEEESEDQPPAPVQVQRSRRKSSVRAPGVSATPGSISTKSDQDSETTGSDQHGPSHPRSRRKSTSRSAAAPRVTEAEPSAPTDSSRLAPVPPPPLVPFFAVSNAPVTQQHGPAPYSATARPTVPPPPLPPRFAALAAVKGLPTMSGVIPKSILQQSKKERSGQPTMWEVADHPNTRDDLHDLRFRTRLRLPLVPMADYQTEKQRLGEDPLTVECPWRTYPRRPRNPQAMTPRLVHENFRVWSIDTREVQRSPKPQRAFLNKMDNTFRGPYFYAPNIRGPVRKKSYPLCKTKQESAAAAETAKRRPSRPSGPQAPAGNGGEQGETSADGTATLKSTQETQTDKD